MTLQLTNIKYTEDFIKADPNNVPEQLVIEVEDKLVEKKGKDYAIYKGLFLKYGKPFADGITGCDSTELIPPPEVALKLAEQAE